MVHNYIIRHNDIIAICDCAIASYNGNIFFLVSKVGSNKYVALTRDGEKYPLPAESVNLIRTIEGWWKVNAIYHSQQDIAKYGDVSYDIDPIDREIGYVLDLVFSDRD